MTDEWNSQFWRQLLADLVALPGPPGQENAVRDFLVDFLQQRAVQTRTDAKGNVLAWHGDAFPEKPTVVVTAHLDEIALMVSHIDADGAIGVLPLGGAHVWKWGEGPVELLLRENEFLPGVLSLGSIHTEAAESVIAQARAGNVPTWTNARVWTGLDKNALQQRGVRPGTRVVLARTRRTVFPLVNGLLGAYFWDDRADVAAWLHAVCTHPAPGILWIATASEETGGEGILYALRQNSAPICVALEIGPNVPDTPVAINDQPTVWVSDGYAAMQPRDLELLADCGRELGLELQWQALSRGGSDASCAAAAGLCARPVTLAFAAQNSHGFEIMHKDAPQNLARLLITYLEKVNKTQGQEP